MFVRFVIASVVLFGATVAVAGPLCEDERAALRFLDFVSAPMSVADEKEWWDIAHGMRASIYEIKNKIPYKHVGWIGVKYAIMLTVERRHQDETGS